MTTGIENPQKGNVSTRFKIFRLCAFAWVLGFCICSIPMPHMEGPGYGSLGNCLTSICPTFIVVTVGYFLVGAIICVALLWLCSASGG